MKNYYLNLKIKTKILLGFCVVLGIMLFMIIYTLIGLRGIIYSHENLISGHFVRRDARFNYRFAHETMQRHVNAMILYGGAGDTANVELSYFHARNAFVDALLSLKLYNNLVIHDNDILPQEEDLRLKTSMQVALILDNYYNNVIQPVFQYALAGNVVAGMQVVENGAEISIHLEEANMFLDSLSDTWIAGIRKTNAQNQILTYWLIAILLTLIGIVSISITIITANSINKRMKKLSQYAMEVSQGNFRVCLRTDDKDEMGQLHNFIANMVEPMNKLITDLEYIKEKAEKGTLSMRVDTAEYMGSYQEATMGINKVIDILVDNNMAILDIFHDYAEGNFDKKLKPYMGESKVFNEISGEMQKELKNIYQAVLQVVGSRDLHYRLDPTKHKGDWNTLLSGINQLLDSFTKPLLEARNESKAKTQFLARMSHEIRTPLNAVLGISDIELQKNIHTLETEEAFRRIYDSSRLLLTIVNDILDLSKVEAGKMEIIPNTYETAILIADTLQLNFMYAKNKSIEFTLIVDENLPSFFVGDELRIKQILNNLLSNAFKYTPEGRITLKFCIEGEATADDVFLRISVSDTGQGMTSEQLDKLFGTEYIRFNLEQNRGIEGSGLGMAITYSLVKMMGGDITVISEPNKGSTFTVRIPQKTDGMDVLGKALSESLQNFEITKIYAKGTAFKSHEPMPYGRVLVVDDVESNLYVIKGYLMPYKLTVETVNNGFDAIARIKNGQIYDVVFMDHMMPDIDGIEVTKILRNLGYNHPIVALTANATFDAAQMFMDNGFTGFISKPIDPLKLDACLMEFIHAKQPHGLLVIDKPKDYKHESVDVQNLPEKLKASFLMDTAKSIPILESIMQMETIDSNAFKMYTIQTHAMKSALTNIQHLELAETAAILENAGRTKDEDNIKNQTAEFLQGLREVTQYLSKGREADTFEVVEDSLWVSTQLLAISKTCEAYDTQGTQDLLNELKKIPLSKNTTMLIGEIEKHLLLSDDDNAAVLAKQAADEIIMKKENEH
ncbi:MAG: ATP-binding protein [Defluviitaleaceae bacterium]|nr:ATP-binding protein [Defluviitaleaceae bacterium]